MSRKNRGYPRQGSEAYPPHKFSGAVIVTVILAVIAIAIAIVIARR
jgi:hypothetical protein